LHLVLQCRGKGGPKAHREATRQRPCADQGGRDPGAGGERRKGPTAIHSEEPGSPQEGQRCSQSALSRIDYSRH